MKLYSYYRSSAAYRVRIALNLKAIEHTIVPVNLLTGEHQSEEYKAKQPQGLVPCLELDNGSVIAQSGAILQYLESVYPQPALTPIEPVASAQVRTLIDLIACDIHPLDNLRVLKYLTQTLSVAEDEKTAWYHHWIHEGFQALESQLQAQPYCLGVDISLVDIYLIPQVYNALRFKVDMQSYPKIMAVYHACNTLSAFKDAAPEAQL